MSFIEAINSALLAVAEAAEDLRKESETWPDKVRALGEEWRKEIRENAVREEEERRIRVIGHLNSLAESLGEPLDQTKLHSMSLDELFALGRVLIAKSKAETGF